MAARESENRGISALDLLAGVILIAVILYVGPAGISQAFDRLRAWGQPGPAVVQPVEPAPFSPAPASQGGTWSLGDYQAALDRIAPGVRLIAPAAAPGQLIDAGALAGEVMQEATTDGVATMDVEDIYAICGVSGRIDLNCVATISRQPELVATPGALPALNLPAPSAGRQIEPPAAPAQPKLAAPQQPRPNRAWSSPLLRGVPGIPGQSQARPQQQPQPTVVAPVPLPVPMGPAGMGNLGIPGASAAVCGENVSCAP